MLIEEEQVPDITMTDRYIYFYLSAPPSWRKFRNFFQYNRHNLRRAPTRMPLRFLTRGSPAKQNEKRGDVDQTKSFTQKWRAGLLSDLFAPWWNKGGENRRNRQKPELNSTYAQPKSKARKQRKIVAGKKQVVSKLPVLFRTPQGGIDYKLPIRILYIQWCQAEKL